MFEIQVADTDVTGGAIPVSWCLDPKLAQVMFDEYGLDPQVVLVVAPVNNYHARKEIRKVVPLRDLLTYMEFKTSGANKIWAFITHHPTKIAKAKFLSRNNGEYSTDILESDGTGWSWNFHKQSVVDGELVEVREPHYNSIIDVNVPAEAFAPEPAQWEKDWVNHFFSSKSPDQCHFRRRRMFAYVVQPVIMALQMVLRLLITVVALLIGARNFSFKPLLHPLQNDMGEQMEVLTGGTVFVRELHESAPDDPGLKLVFFLLKKFCFLPFMPIILGLIVLVFLVSPVALTIAGGVLLAAIVILCVLGLGIAFIDAKGIERVQAFFKKKEVASMPLSQEELAILYCSPERRVLTFKSMPTNKKTIKLRFLDLKSKVCRPFSA